MKHKEQWAFEVFFQRCFLSFLSSFTWYLYKVQSYQFARYIFSAINDVIWCHTFICLNKGHAQGHSKQEVAQCDKIPPLTEGLWKRINLNTTDWKNKKHHFCTYMSQIFLAFFTHRHRWWFHCHFVLTAFEKKKKECIIWPPGCCRSGSYMKWTQRTNLDHLITVSWKSSVNWKKKEKEQWCH